MKQQYVRITALAKLLNTCEKATDNMLQSGVIVFQTPEEVEAFKKGVRAVIDLIRGEFEIKPE